MVIWIFPPSSISVDIFFVCVCALYLTDECILFGFALKISEATFRRRTHPPAAANTEDLSRKNGCSLKREMLRERHEGDIWKSKV